MAKELSIGLVEVSGLGHAIIMLDDMLKAADVEFVATERRLGGRLVTIVVQGELTAVQASVDAGIKRAKACSDSTYKASQVIARPHPEILPFLHLDEKDTDKDVTPNTESASTHVGKVGAAKQSESVPATKKTTTKKSTAKKAPAKKSTTKTTKTTKKDA